MVKKLINFFHSENSVRTASILLLVTLFISNLLGLVRDHFLASYIKTSELDIYFAAFRIPDLIFNMLILGAISSAFIPVFCEYIGNDKRKEGWHIANSFLNLAVLAMLVCSIIIFIFMPSLTSLVVPNFSDAAKQETASISRILTLTPIFFSASYIFSGVLNSFNRFAAYSLAPLVYNLSIIIGTLFFSKTYGIWGVAIFVVIGAFLHMAIQIPSAIKIGFTYKFVLDYGNKSIKKILKLMIPRTIGLSINQILLLFYTAIASTLAAGSISAFNFANNIQTMPTVVFGTSFATAVFPTLTTSVSKQDPETFSKYLNKSIRTILYLLIPIAMIFILLRAQIIRLILGSGYFVWQDTKLTALTLGYFAISIPFQGIIPLLAKSFFALKNTKTPMIISSISAVIGIIFGYYLAPGFGAAGLALAFSIGSAVNALGLFFAILSVKYYKFDFPVFTSIIKIIAIDRKSVV